MPDDIRPTAPPRGPRLPAPAPSAASTADQSTDDGRTGPYAPGSVPAEATPPPGYEILGELGRGGMGVVYKARQLSLNRTVALKMVLGGVHATPADRLRFLNEAGAAAKLHHPNIVGVYEVGRHGDLPYFTLEYVAGGPLTKHAKDPLAPRAAAELIEPIARGVAHAHANGVIHRDLKPDNVLMEGSVPKVADFGLAKTLDSSDGLTATGAVMGTPSYMAPEQAAGDAKRVGPPADVYALGAVLYRLLTGRPPFAAPTPFETIHQVLTADPPAPSDLVPKLPRDLVTICLKCLRKDPRQRYASADELADDLQRFLTGKPIAARPIGRLERGWKWTKRHGVLVGAAAAVFLALSAGAAVATWQAVEATEAREKAEEEATNARTAEGNAKAAEAVAVREKDTARREEQKATAVKEFLQVVFYQSTARGQATPTRVVNRNLTVKAAMDNAVRELAVRFADEPLIEAELRKTIGNAYTDLGAFPEADAQFARALELYAPLGPDHAETLSCVNSLGVLRREQGKLDEAVQLGRRAMEGLNRVLGPDHRDALATTSNLAESYIQLAQFDEAERLLRRALEGAERSLDPDDPHFPAYPAGLARVHGARGQFAEAERWYLRALTAAERACGRDHPQTIRVSCNLAMLYREWGKFDKAESLAVKTLAVCERIYGPDHPDTYTLVNELGLQYLQRRLLDRAEPYCIRALAGLEKTLGPDHFSTLACASNLASMYMFQRRFAEAEPMFQRILTTAERTLGPDHVETLRAANNLGGVYKEQGQIDRAEPLFARVVAGRERALGPDNPATLRAMDNLAGVYKAKRNYAEAERLFRRALDGFERASGPTHPDTLTCLNYLAELYEIQEQPDRAEPYLRKLLAAREKTQPTAWTTFSVQSRLGGALHARKNYAEAEPLLKQGYTGLKQRAAAIPPAARSLRLREAADRLARLYEATGKPAEAEKWRAEAASYRELAPRPRPAR